MMKRDKKPLIIVLKSLTRFPLESMEHCLIEFRWWKIDVKMTFNERHLFGEIIIKVQVPSSITKWKTFLPLLFRNSTIYYVFKLSHKFTVFIASQFIKILLSLDHKIAMKLCSTVSYNSWHKIGLNYYVTVARRTKRFYCHVSIFTLAASMRKAMAVQWENDHN